MKKKSKFRIIKRIISSISLVLCFIVLCIISSIISFIFFNKHQLAQAKNEAANKVASINADTFKEVGPTIIYDKNDKEIYRVSELDYTYTNYNEIPDLMKDTFIATEDSEFYKHGAISLKGMSRALFDALKNKGSVEQGGSTITQQLVKTVFLSQDRTFQRKYTEILIAEDMEKKYSKEQILEFYLNNINFGNGAYGAATAAHTYFNKPLQQLSLAEITYIAAIPNNPTYYNPLKYPEHVKVRQQLMLKNLKNQKYITDKQYTEALNTNITLNYQPHKNPEDNYVSSYAIDCAVRKLMENDGFKFKYSFDSDSDRDNYENSFKEKYQSYDKKIRKGGYNIYTSLDMDKQKQLQESLDTGLSDFDEKDDKTGLYKMQGAAVCIDNPTGEVTAIVGGRDQDKVANYYNRAFLAVRQPGSSIKPVLVYTPAFDKGYTPDYIITDKYIPKGPKNAENYFFGPVTLRYATEMSLNTVAYQMLIKEGVQYGLSYLYKMNFEHIVKEDNSPIIAVGGFTYGATPVEMAGAYSTIERGGEFIQPTCLRKITKTSGEPVFVNQHVKVRVYKQESTQYMTDILKGVLTETYATGYGLALDNITSAGKTGTTSDSKDGWFAGYTPYMTTVVWVGYDNPTSISSLYGATYPGQIWNSFMNKAHIGLDSIDFK
ncbi:MAG: transglycosylase domain-containing protein [Bacillota bacterium]|nr:transglycosylase domain-containing protein [Bacillota bacterium]